VIAVPRTRQATGSIATITIAWRMHGRKLAEHMHPIGRATFSMSCEAAVLRFPTREYMSSRQYRKRIYERYASGMECSAIEPSKRYFWKYLAGHLSNRSDRILELGAGAGGLIEFLRATGFDRVSGVDASAEQVALARSRGIDVELGDALGALRARPDASLDTIIAVDLLEHLTKAEVFELLDECFRVLVAGGRLVVHTVNGDSPFFGTVRFGDFTHETTFTRASMGQVLRTVGFRDVACLEDRPLVHGMKSAARAVIWQLVRTGLVFVLAAETGTLDRTRVLSQNFLVVATK
jgi:SAM-dependent methyltransferase